jgi:DNA-binding response OmpR family regulator
VVDDDHSVVEVLDKTLSQHGYEVLRADTSEQAIAAIQGHGAPVDLLIVDGVMPNVSGPELADILLFVRPQMKVLFVTGLDGLSIHLAFGRPCECLQKPFTMRLLVAKVGEMLGHAIPYAESQI